MDSSYLILISLDKSKQLRERGGGGGPLQTSQLIQYLHSTSNQLHLVSYKLIEKNNA